MRLWPFPRRAHQKCPVCTHCDVRIQPISYELLRDAMNNVRRLDKPDNDDPEETS